MNDILVLRDFTEDHRYSMEIYADSLAEALKKNGASDIQVREFVPKMPKFLDNIQGMRFARYVLYPLQVIGKRASVYHISEHGYGHLTNFLDRKKTVVTVHDLIPVVCWKGGIPGAVPEHVPLLAYHSLKSLRKARHLIADSLNTKRDLEKYLGCDPKKISVIPPGVDEIFQPMPIEQTKAAKAKWFGEQNTDIHIMITGHKFYKNPEIVLKTLELIRVSGYENVKIITTRKPSASWGDLVSKYRMQSHVINLGNVPRADLPALYNAVDILFFPSLYEGFGWPPLEAMACGTPTVASNAASLPEVIGDAAAMFDPLDYVGFSGEIIRLFSDSDYRKMRITRGFLQAKRFDWNETARKILEVYKGIVEND